MNTAEIEKLPASAQTERRKLLAAIGRLETQRVDAEAKSETGADPSYQRLAFRLGKDVATAYRRLEDFDQVQARKAAMAESDEAQAATRTAQRAAAAFEKSLLKFAADAAALITASRQLADAQGESDPARWPHPHQVSMAINTRAQSVLTGAGLRFQSHSVSNAQPITKRFNT